MEHVRMLVCMRQYAHVLICPLSSARVCVCVCVCLCVSVCVCVLAGACVLLRDCVCLLYILCVYLHVCTKHLRVLGKHMCVSVCMYDIHIHIYNVIYTHIRRYKYTSRWSMRT